MTPPGDGVVVTVRDVGKAYRLYDRPQDRLKHMLLSRVGRPYGREFWALRHVSFEVRRGETLGIIGRNGSGKSTLLQLIAGIVQPSEGDVRVAGTVGALLELGSGFNPEYTGRENVLTNAAILGVPSERIAERLDEITAFAEIDDFIDQPVKTYSSGMFVRLAFAVTTSVEADVLLIDEALAVGDVFFRQKCYRRLEALRAGGTAIVLVSHATGEIEQFCQRAILLHGGRAQFIGSAAEAVKRYYLVEQAGSVPPPAPPASTEPAGPAGDAPGPGFAWPGPEALLDLARVKQIANGAAVCRGVAVCDADGRPCRVFEQGERASFFYEFEVLEDVEVPTGGVELVDERGIIVHGKSTIEHGTAVPVGVARGQRLRFRQDIALELAVGEYTFNIGMGAMSRADYARCALSSHIECDARLTRVCLLPAVGALAVVFRRPGAPAQLLHHGVANLPGSCQVMLVPPASMPPVGTAALPGRRDPADAPLAPR